MKYLVLLLFLVGCCEKEAKYEVDAKACSKDGCKYLETFKNMENCHRFINTLAKNTSLETEVVFTCLEIKK